MIKLESDFFHRTALAQAYAEEALDTSMGCSGGLFLAAPRRTGKSTFARQDLVPVLGAMGAEVIYVDLWADRAKDPALLLANAVRAELKQKDGALAKLARGVGLTNFTLGALGSGLNFDLSQVGLSSESTLSDALGALSKANGQMIVLVIDEAQHALTTAAGVNSLFALKAARDALNLAGKGLQVIATGSNRDKLAMLVNGREQPFFGATMIDFPKLGPDYIAWVCAKAKIALDPERTFGVFKEAGSRPEMLLPAIRKLRLVQISQDENLDDEFARLVRDGISRAKDDFLHTLGNLPPLQAALLRELAENSTAGSGAGRVGVFSAAMLQKLKARIGGASHGDGAVQVDASAVQNALDSLREKNLLWKSQRGAYWIEDEQVVGWMVAMEPIPENEFIVRLTDGQGERDVAHATLEAALQEFMQAPAAHIPRVMLGGTTLAAHGPEAGMAPVFADPSVEVLYWRLHAAQRQGVAPEQGPSVAKAAVASAPAPVRRSRDDGAPRP